MGRASWWEVTRWVHARGWGEEVEDLSCHTLAVIHQLVSPTSLSPARTFILSPQLSCPLPTQQLQFDFNGHPSMTENGLHLVF